MSSFSQLTDIFKCIISYEENYGKCSLNNQRFAEVTLQSDEPQININQISISAYNKKAYLTYSIDCDNDSATLEDMEIYSTIIIKARD